MIILIDNRGVGAPLTRHMKSLFVPLVLCGCQPVSQVGAQSDATIATVPDAPGTPNTCNGTGNSFVYSGAVAFEAYDFGMITLSGQVVGLAGSALNSDVLSFDTRPLTELETLADHDVAVQNITALRAPFNQSCDSGNTVCHGFFAQAGTFTVHALHPRYQATFTLSNLLERTDNSGPPGAPIAGTITGCVDKANP
jgi:hypothetical protein